MIDNRSDKVKGICNEHRDSACGGCQLKEACKTHQGDTKEIFDARMNAAADSLDDIPLALMDPAMTESGNRESRAVIAAEYEAAREFYHSLVMSQWSRGDALRAALISMNNAKDRIINRLAEGVSE